MKSHWTVFQEWISSMRKKANIKPNAIQYQGQAEYNTGNCIRMYFATPIYLNIKYYIFEQ
jgi:hypothetical protein